MPGEEPEGVENECLSAAEVEAVTFHFPGAGSLSAVGSRTHIEGSMGAEGPVDLSNTVALLAAASRRWAVQLEKGFLQLESGQRQAARTSDESKFIDGARIQGEFKGFTHV